MEREALKLALEALEANYLLVNGTETHSGLEQCLDGYYSICFDTEPINKKTKEAIAFIHQALAQPAQEPVAHWSDCAVHNEPAYPKGECDCGGYTPPAAQRPWVELTGNEWFEWWRVSKIADETETEIDFCDFLIIAQAVTDKLKDDNK